VTSNPSRITLASYLIQEQGICYARKQSLGSVRPLCTCLGAERELVHSDPGATLGPTLVDSACHGPHPEHDNLRRWLRARHTTDRNQSCVLHKAEVLRYGQSAINFQK
jgi:hypothetical protein